MMSSSCEVHALAPGAAACDLPACCHSLLHSVQSVRMVLLEMTVSSAQQTWPCLEMASVSHRQGWTAAVEQHQQNSISMLFCPTSSHPAV